MFTQIGTFFIDQWLWSITWDWYHIPLSMVIMILLFRFFLRMDIIISVLLALGSIAATFITFTFFVVSVLIGLFKFRYEAALGLDVADSLHACIYVALIYTTLQAVFFIILNRYYTIEYRHMIIVSLVSNLISACFIYQLLPAIG